MANAATIARIDALLQRKEYAQVCREAAEPPVAADAPEASRR